jgi:hypothetical protein
MLTVKFHTFDSYSGLVQDNKLGRWRNGHCEGSSASSAYKEADNCLLRIIRNLLVK